MKHKLIVFLLLFAVMHSFAQSPWPAIQQQTKPWTRWWWMGSAVDQPNIARLLAEYHKAGFGGVEITPIYGAIGYESRYIDFLSPKWVSMLRYTVQRTRALGMGVDMNTGTGWPFGGPQITPEYAASKLTVKSYDLQGNQPFTTVLKVDSPGIKEFTPRLQALTAYGNKGQVINLLDKADANGKFSWTPPAGNWQLVAGFLDKTGQAVKRSAPGGAGYTMDHLSKPALATYLKRFDTALGPVSPGVRCFFNDSYEVYNANLSPGLFAEFIKRRGYDVRDHIRELTGRDSNETVSRIRTDYRETISDLILENFTQPWKKWINGKKALSRNQAHGSPGNMLDLYGTVDIPETETFGLTRFPIPGLNFYTNDNRNVPPDPIMLKFASSGAHINGKQLASSETFTWLGEHFKVPLSHAKAEVEQVFLSGVNHVFYHGTAYSPQDVPWPGWLFYASVEFNPQNSIWPHVSGLNEYITRCQSVLQSGRTDNELLVYWPMYDVWNDAPAKLDFQLAVHTVDQWLQPTDFYKTTKKLMDNGYSVDFISDRQIAASKVAGTGILTSAAASPYKTLILPTSRFMPVATFENALKLASHGATLILQKLPNDVPGYDHLEERRAQLAALVNGLKFKEVAEGVKEAKTGTGTVLLAKEISNALSYKNIFREELVDQGLKFIRRKSSGATWYFIVNHTAKTIDRKVPVNAKGEVTILDPLTGNYGKGKTEAAGGKTLVDVQMPPGQSLILKVSTKGTAPAPVWKYLASPGKKMNAEAAYSLKFTAGGPVLPKPENLHQLGSWTALPDADASRFSGSGTYDLSFQLPAKNAGEYVLDLGDVRESAHIWVNGRDAGILWSVPYKARIGKFLKPGANAIKVEVANLMANRIRDLDQRKVEWRKYHEINFVDLFYLPFDASKWDIQPSGLLGPITITPYTLN